MSAARTLTDAELEALLEKAAMKGAELARGKRPPAETEPDRPASPSAHQKLAEYRRRRGQPRRRRAA